MATARAGLVDNGPATYLAVVDIAKVPSRVAEHFSHAWVAIHNEILAREKKLDDTLIDQALGLATKAEGKHDRRELAA